MTRALIAATVLFVFVGLAQAGIRADLSGDAVIDFQTTMDMPFMAVGNPGNAGELSGVGWPFQPPRICGAVDYTYHIGKFEVTTGQYCEFLNAVASVADTYYLSHMKRSTQAYDRSCMIERQGTAGNYTYTVGPDRADRPVNYMTWGSAARFCNWLHNGRPTGEQDLTTTEDGSYYLNGATSGYDIALAMRKADATYVLPTEDEWYKAAYHANDGATGNYYDYATGSDTIPSNSFADSDPGNNANFYDHGTYVWHDLGGYTIGEPFWRTEVGEFENSPSPYGTFDMCGNILEWTEPAQDESPYALSRGGDYTIYPEGLDALSANARFIPLGLGVSPAGSRVGFRVALVPEPATLGLLALGGLALTKRRRWR